MHTKSVCSIQSCPFTPYIFTFIWNMMFKVSLIIQVPRCRIIIVMLMLMPKYSIQYFTKILAFERKPRLRIKILNKSVSDHTRPLHVDKMHSIGYNNNPQHVLVASYFETFSMLLLLLSVLFIRRHGSEGIFDSANTLSMWHLLFVPFYPLNCGLCLYKPQTHRLDTCISMIYTLNVRFRIKSRQTKWHIAL